MLKFAARSTFRAGLSFRPFPRQPVFFSTTARQWTSSNSTTNTADDTTSQLTPHQPKAKGDEVPKVINLGTPAEAVSCTVSPPSTFAFLKPTPVVLLTGPFGGNWCYRDTWQETLADQGYQTTSIELAMPRKRLDSGDDYIRHFVKVLKKSIETDHSFYPPILIAHGLHALVAQKYVESNPVSALVLVSPFIPEVIQGRFQELSRKLHQARIAPSATSKTATSKTATSKTATTATALSADTPPSSIKEPLEGATVVAEDRKAELQAAAMDPVTKVEPALTHYKFETHADVLEQEGFRERFVLPEKAVYKIDRVAKELHDKEEREKIEKEKSKEKEVLITKEEAEAKTKADAMASGADESNGSSEALSSQETLAATTIPEPVSEESLGKDSIPVLESTKEQSEDEAMPVQTVESEESIRSPLEQLPLSIYNTIPTSIFEPNFPILLVTSNADEIVSTADVKDHHILAGQVDHIELEDLDDGGHLIMVADNAEWEQGIRGITEWLDSNGM